MVHLFYETGDFLDQSSVLLLLSLTWNVRLKVRSGHVSQEPAFGLDSEEDKLNVSIDVDFDLPSVALVELVAILVCWFILDFCQSFPDPWDHFSEKVEKGVNVKSLLY